jgi:hypothetical protein
MIKLTNQIGSLIGPVETTDAAFDDDVGRIMIGIQASLGVLDPADVLRIESILEKYASGGSGSVTNSVGSTRFGDASDAAEVGRKAAARVRANIENNQSVAAGYKAFWDKNLAENRASIRR